MGHPIRLLFLLVLISLSKKCQSSWDWDWKLFRSSTENPSNTKMISNGNVAQFSMEAHNDEKGIQRVEKAKKKLVESNSCWQNAYRSVFSACSEMMADEEKRRKLAWHLSDCFQKDTGGSPFICAPHSDMKDCLVNLKEDARGTFLHFFIDANSICHQLQSDAFKRETERLVNDLKKTAQFAEERLENIEERSEHLLQSSKQIHDSLTSIDLQTQEVAQVSKNIENHIDVVLKHSEAVFEQSKAIAASQSELQERQAKMKEKMMEGMAMLHESYSNLGQEIGDLRNEAVEMEKEINKVGNDMSSKMINLQSKANDIGNIAGISLDKQKQLLDGQSIALEGLQFLTKFQSQALEESRGTLQQLAEFSSKQQDELLQRQELLQQAHDHLVENSKSILAAQEAFESKQASMFLALDKLFNLHKAMLNESRLIKAFFMYSLLIFILYMFTSTKQTYAVRPRLYIGLCAAFLIEFSILRFATDDIENQTWIINLVRSLFVLLAAIQLLHAICTYRDYEVLNHQMLLSLMEKVNGMQKNIELSWDTDSDDDIKWSSWIDTELPEDVDKLKDPDYIVPAEEFGENLIVTTPITRKYDLRHRPRHP